jgi:hypothetical protein
MYRRFIELLRRFSESMRGVPVCAAPALLLLASCGLADLRPVSVTTVPEKSETVLPGGHSPVILKFDTEMERREAEKILQISSSLGAVEGDLRWEGNSLFFTPSAGWTAGIRYGLTLSGMAHSEDGRELRLDRYISFYALNKNPAPLLKQFSPGDGVSVGTEPLMEFFFTRSMDRLSVETSFMFDGTGDKQFEWSADDTILKVKCGKALSPWRVYHWSLGTKALSRDGVPLAEEVSAQFSTDEDRIRPRVLSVYPALSSGGRWIPSGGDIEDRLGPGQGIAVEFNKPMGESVLGSLRFDPSLAGRTERLSEKSVVFIPNRDPEPETAYRLFVSADARDSGGLRLGEDYSLVFVPDIPFLRILSFNADGSPPLEPDSGGGGDLGRGTILAVKPDMADGGVLRFTIRFSLPFDTEARQDAIPGISLSPFFPGILNPVALRFVTWLSDDRVRMEWERLEPGGSGEPHYYRLLVPGGRGGISPMKESGTAAGGGIFLREDQYLYLEAVN